MEKLQVKINNVTATVSEAAVEALAPAAAASIEKLVKGTGAGNDFLGWVNLPTRTP